MIWFVLRTDIKSIGSTMEADAMTWEYLQSFKASVVAAAGLAPTAEVATQASASGRPTQLLEYCEVIARGRVCNVLLCGDSLYYP